MGSQVDASADRVLLLWAEDRGSGCALESADAPGWDASHSVAWIRLACADCDCRRRQEPENQDEPAVADAAGVDAARLGHHVRDGEVENRQLCKREREQVLRKPWPGQPRPDVRAAV